MARRRPSLLRRVCILLILVLSSALTMADDWPTYLHDASRSGGSQNETVLTPANVPHLVKLWSYKTASVIAAQPVIANGTVYVGSWDGYEYALDTNTGAVRWKTFLGITTAPCSTQGISSAAAVQNGIVYVGGGDAYWYALDATTGNVLWKIYTGDNSAASGHYNWASSVIYNGYAYIGVSSLCDDPLVQGQLLQVDLTSHQIVHTANLVPDGQVGGGVWTTPAVDPATNTIYLTTGTNGVADTTQQPLTLAMVALDASTLAVKSSWQIPAAQQTSDSDWGNTPLLYTDANGRQMVAAANKNGYLYAFARANVGAGPVWQRTITVSGPDPIQGDGTASSGAYGNGLLYVAGGNTTINGAPAAGAVRAVDPTTGNIAWEHSTPNMVISSIVYANGLVVAAGGKYGGSNDIEVLSASTGARLYSYNPGNTAFFALSLANGQIYAGATDGNLYVLGMPSPAATATATPLPDANCPSGWACQDIGGATPAGSETVSGSSYTLTAGGADIGGTADQFRFLATGASGDTQITAQVSTQQAGNTQAKAGLMIRQSSDPGAPYYGAFLTPGSGLVVQYRAQPGGVTTTATTSMASTTAPVYLQIQRHADSFSTAVSPDGNAYTLVPGSQAQVVLPASVLDGLAVTSHDVAQTSTAQFSSVASGPPSAPPATPTPATDSACPLGWNCQDIGNFVPTGNETLSAGNWTVQAAGQDIVDATDQFRYIWQPFAGDGAVSARIVSQTNTDPRAKAGVMLRASADPAAAFYAVFVTPGKGVIIQYRNSKGEFTRIPTTTGGVSPLYLRVLRAGATFEASSSPDGVAWSPISQSDVQISMGNGVLGGLAVTSHAPGTLSTAQIDSVSMSSQAPTCTAAPGGTVALAASYCSSAPATWFLGQTQTYTVTVTNTGTQTWSAGGNTPVRLGVEFGTTDDTPGTGWATDQRFNLSADVPPGGSQTLTVNVTAPATAGNYILRHRMVQENVAWFNQIQKANVVVGTFAASYSSSPPVNWTPNQTQSYTVTVTNTGSLPWSASLPNPVHLGISFGTVDDTPGVGWATDQRFSLSSDVPPGGSQTFTVAVTAPATTGSYVLRHRIVAEHVTWFSQMQKTSVTVTNTATPTAMATATTTPTNTAVPTNTATPSPTPPMLAASYSSSPATSWVAGQMQTYTVTVTNIGSQNWSAGGTNPVRLGVHFGGASDSPGVGWATDQRFNLTADVPPGGSQTLTVNVTAPITGGSYVLRQQMVQEQVAWFSQIQKTNVVVATLAASYSSSPPTIWSPLQTQTYAISVTNTGTLQWNATGTNPVYLGVQFGTANDTPETGWATDQWFALSSDVAPGGTQTFTVSVTAPASGGSYVLRHRMVKANVAWFDQIQKTAVTVGSPPTPTSTVTATPSATPTVAALAASYSSSPPTTWFPSQKQTYSITVTNTGSQNWNASGTNPVRLGVHFGGASDSPGVGWATDQRFNLTADVPPGGSQTLTVSVTAPATGGSYVLRQQLVKEQVAWFNQIQKTNVNVGTLSASYSSSPFTGWSTGQTQAYTITVTNTGTLTWNASGANLVRLGVHFGGASDSPGVGWATDQRFGLTADVPPGGAQTLTVKVTAPTTAGSYVLRQQMVKEQVAWFSQIQKTNVTVGP